MKSIGSNNIAYVQLYNYCILMASIINEQQFCVIQSNSDLSYGILRFPLHFYDDKSGFDWLY